MPYPWRSRRESVQRINMSSEAGAESFCCALFGIPRILSLEQRSSRVKVCGPESPYERYDAPRFVRMRSRTQRLLGDAPPGDRNRRTKIPRCRTKDHFYCLRRILSGYTCERLLRIELVRRLRIGKCFLNLPDRGASVSPEGFQNRRFLRFALSSAYSPSGTSETDALPARHGHVQFSAIADMFHSERAHLHFIVVPPECAAGGLHPVRTGHSGGCSSYRWSQRRP